MRACSIARLSVDPYSLSDATFYIIWRLSKCTFKAVTKTCQWHIGKRWLHDNHGHEIRCNTLIRSAVTPIAVTSPPALFQSAYNP